MEFVLKHFKYLLVILLEPVTEFCTKEVSLCNLSIVDEKIHVIINALNATLLYSWKS